MINNYICNQSGEYFSGMVIGARFHVPLQIHGS